jgi:hypothetical protein
VKLFALFLTALSVLASESGNIGNLRVFPGDNAWNWDISGYAVHPNSNNYVASIGATVKLHPDFGTVWNNVPSGIPYIVTKGADPLIPITYDYADESDSGPFPIPLDAPIEGGPDATGDRHVIVVDTAHKRLYELYSAYPKTTYWQAGSGATWDLTSNALRPAGWTSADAAGLPIFPGLVRYEEVMVKKVISHAIRFTVQNSQKKYLYPARHYASSSTDTNRPPMGLRFRLKSGFNIAPFSEPVRVILRAMKKYGIIVADNGGNWYISGAPDDRWNDDSLGQLKTIAGSNFEAVLTVDSKGNPIFPPTAAEQGRTDASHGGPVLSVSPNPTNGLVTLAVSVPDRAGYRITVFDTHGKKVREFSGTENVRVQWIMADGNGRPLPNGMYFCRLQTAPRALTRSVLLLR